MKRLAALLLAVAGCAPITVPTDQGSARQVCRSAGLMEGEIDNIVAFAREDRRNGYTFSEMVNSILNDDTLSPEIQQCGVSIVREVYGR